VKRPTDQTRLRDTIVHLRHAEYALDQAELEARAPETHAAARQLRQQVEEVRRRAQRALARRRTSAA
jgi:hypothetical protein